MKRIVYLTLAAVMCMSLCACKSKEVTGAEELINQIGGVTLDSESAIVAAETAVAALTEKDLQKLENLQVLKDARTAYDVRDNELVEVCAAIDELGDVTLEREETISAARRLYESKGEDIKARVDNYAVLTAAETMLTELKVAEVVRLINEIGTVTLNSGDKISVAQSAYNSLSADAKSKVENANVISEAKQTLSQLEEEEAERAKKAAISKLKSTTDRVEGITWYEAKVHPTYTNTRSFVLPYIGKNSSNVWLRVKCNYTGDDWVFFENVIFVVDGEKYTKYFSYYDVDRDNGYGDVWEVADFAPSTSDIEMLKKIADSKETIIRFEGDSKRRDITVKSTDKQAIKDVILAYEAMK